MDIAVAALQLGAVRHDFLGQRGIALRRCLDRAAKRHSHDLELGERGRLGLTKRLLEGRALDPPGSTFRH